MAGVEIGRARGEKEQRAGEVGGLAPGIDVRTAFLENARPALPAALSLAVSDAGRDAVGIVPLLLAPGYHLSQDIGRAAALAGVVEEVAQRKQAGPGAFEHGHAVLANFLEIAGMTPRRLNARPARHAA